MPPQRSGYEKETLYPKETVWKRLPAAFTGSPIWRKAVGVVILSTMPKVLQGDTQTSCGTNCIRGSCEHGHDYLKTLYCGREWCPVCGEDDSSVHKRRWARWLPRATQCEQLGYWVITFPIHYRTRLAKKKGLQRAYDTAIDVLAGKRTGRRGRVGGFFSRGLTRWHWFGDTPGVFNPHLNVLVDSGWIPPKRVEAIKLEIRRAFHLPKQDINYSYSQSVPEKVHDLKYVARSTFKQEEWFPSFSREIYGFRNVRWWGSWNGDSVWSLEQSSIVDTRLLAIVTGNCPRCGSPISWTGTLYPLAYFNASSYIMDDIGSGYIGLSIDSS